MDYKIGVIMDKKTARQQYRQSYSSRDANRKRTILPILKWYSFDSVLYVGAHPDRLHFVGLLSDYVKHIDVLEIWPENVKFLKTVPYFQNVFLGDVRKIDLVITNKYDLVFWWHGPEHIDVKELPETLSKIEKITNKVILLGCPWGVYEQGAEYNNPHEEHKCHLYLDFFEKLGFLTSTVGQKDNKEVSSSITAWRDVEWKEDC